MIHSPDRSYESSEKESEAGDHSNHGDEELVDERQGNSTIIESSEPMADGVARGQAVLPHDEAIKKRQCSSTYRCTCRTRPGVYH
jgi:hypothetical protein